MAKEKIVVIDDSPIVRKLAELALEEEGYKVYTAEDGEEGLRISEEVRPSVILVDFIMPRISGYQFCKSARENELLKDIPIILITGKGEDVGKKFAEKFGVVDYFIKPFKSEMLVEKVNSIVNSQRELVGEGADILGTGEMTAEPSSELPEFSFAEPAVSEEPVSAVAGIPEIMEPPSFGTEEVPEAEPAAAEAVEEVPEFSFEAVDVQEKEVSPAESLDLGTPSFDFNLEGLTSQDIELEEQKVSAPAVPIVPETYDFAAIQQFRETAAAEDIVEPEPEPAAAEGFGGVQTVESAVDRIMKKYFKDELPMLIEKSMEDILKQHGVIKTSSILITGNLEGIGLNAALKLISDLQMTGKLFVFSMSGSAEIYLNRGQIVYALTSKRGKAFVMGQGPSDETSAEILEGILDALSMISGVKEGSFFFEKMALPAALGVVSQRKNVTALLLESMRNSAGGAGVAVPGNQSSVYIQAISDAAARDCELTDEEQQIFSLADGQRNASIISTISGIDPKQTLLILERLSKAMVLRNQGGF